MLTGKSEYDKNGNNTKVIYPDGNFFSRTYDGLDRFSSLFESDENKVYELKYSSSGSRKSANRIGDNITLTSYIFDDIGRPKLIKHNFLVRAFNLSLTGFL